MSPWWVCAALVGLALATVLVGVVVVSSAASAGACRVSHPVGNKAEHGHAVSQDVSAPLRDIRPARQGGSSWHPDSPMPTPAGATVADPVVHGANPAAVAPSSSTFLLGRMVLRRRIPMARLGQSFVEVVNTSWRLPEDRVDVGCGGVGPVPTNTLWSGFGGECQSENDGDATVVRRVADRWWSASSRSARPAGPFFQCVAVSTTADPTGSYYRYAFGFANFPGLPEAWRVARRLLPDDEHIHRGGLVPRRGDVRIRPGQDAQRAAGNDAVFRVEPVVVRRVLRLAISMASTRHPSGSPTPRLVSALTTPISRHCGSMSTGLRPPTRH